MKRLAKTYAFVALASLGLLNVPVAGGEAPREYELKAAFLYNFAKFTEWPAGAFTNANQPILIGVLGTVEGTNHISDLEQTVRNKAINNHPLQVKEIKIQSLTEVTNCHILFILASEEDRLQGIFDALSGAPVLTVGETEGFTNDRGMIGFLKEQNKIRFQINNGEAKKAGLRISSSLLIHTKRPP